MTERTTYRDITAAFTAVVADVVRVGTTHVRVVLGGMPALALLDTIAVDVGDGQLRRYTVSSVGEGSVEFVAYRTTRGPATSPCAGGAWMTPPTSSTCRSTGQPAPPPPNR